VTSDVTRSGCLSRKLGHILIRRATLTPTITVCVGGVPCQSSSWSACSRPKTMRHRVPRCHAGVDSKRTSFLIVRRPVQGIRSGPTSATAQCDIMCAIFPADRPFRLTFGRSSPSHVPPARTRPHCRHADDSMFTELRIEVATAALTAHRSPRTPSPNAW